MKRNRKTEDELDNILYSPKDYPLNKELLKSKMNAMIRLIDLINRLSAECGSGGEYDTGYYSDEMSSKVTLSFDALHQKIYYLSSEIKTMERLLRAEKLID